MFKELSNELATDAKTFWNFVVRNLFWIIVTVGALYLIGETTSMLQVTLTSVLLECLAIGLSNFAQYVYSRLKFNSEESPHTSILGYIFLGVHILIGLIGFGAYFIQFAGKAT